MRKRSRKSQRTDVGVLATSSDLSKRTIKQSCEEGTVSPARAGLEPREDALTAVAVKSRRTRAGEIRLTAGKDRQPFNFKEAALLHGLKAVVSAPSIG